MWARIENNTVMELTEKDPEGRFHESLVWIPCFEGVEQGYTYDPESQTFSEPEPVEVEEPQVASAGLMSKVFKGNKTA